MISAGPVAEDWVRRDAVPDAGALIAVRDYVRDHVARAQQERARAPRGRCGPTLRPGRLPG
ncbi:hypothetical protein [Saccharothrix saharensis]|uniref:hypothetical protein n=1 Tax=Saccharothrix saharensis TaxID=571190 RepID=UPI001FE669D0|nr:hypothetical protein [Saccharothrix saharensis]